jgi:hypothetical protein
LIRQAGRKHLCPPVRFKTQAFFVGPSPLLSGREGSWPFGAHHVSLSSLPPFPSWLGFVCCGLAVRWRRQTAGHQLRICGRQRLLLLRFWQWRLATGDGANSPSARGADGRLHSTVTSALLCPASWRRIRPRNTDLTRTVRPVAQACLARRGMSHASAKAGTQWPSRGHVGRRATRVAPEPSFFLADEWSAVREPRRESQKASEQVLRSPGAAASASFCPFHGLAFRCPIRRPSEMRAWPPWRTPRDRLWRSCSIDGTIFCCLAFDYRLYVSIRSTTRMQAAG